MKRFLLAVAFVALASGCTKTSSPSDSGRSVGAIFRISAEEIAVKTASDGTKATQLVVGVYDKDSGYLEELSVPVEKASSDAFSGLHATYSVILQEGHSYDFVFLAQTPGNPFYDIDLPSATMTVLPTGLANVEERDAFYGRYSLDAVDSEVFAEITLHRPFAQLNVVSEKEDFELARAADIQFEKSSFRVSAPTVLHLLSGKADTPALYDMGPNVIAEHPDFAPYAGDYWISTGYILATQEKNLFDVSFSVYEKGSAESLYTTVVNGVPLQRNYRTTIHGSVLTAEGGFDIVVDPLYSGQEDLTF